MQVKQFLEEGKHLFVWVDLICEMVKVPNGLGYLTFEGEYWIG